MLGGMGKREGDIVRDRDREKEKHTNKQTQASQDQTDNPHKLCRNMLIKTSLRLKK